MNYSPSDNYNIISYFKSVDITGKEINKELESKNGYIDTSIKKISYADNIVNLNAINIVIIFIFILLLIYLFMTFFHYVYKYSDILFDPRSKSII